MLESADVVKDNFQKETYQLSAKVQLQRYGSFLDKYNYLLQTFEGKLPEIKCIDAKPITMKFQPEEDISLLQLVHSDNKLLSRILASLASLCSEINSLVSEAKDKYYTKFILYGEVIGKGTENLQMFSKLLETLQQLSFFVKRSQQVISLLLHQLSAISGKELYVNNSTIYFPEPLDNLAELLVCFMTLDNLLVSTTLQEHWTLYKRAIKNTLHSPTQFGIEVDRVKFLSKILIDIENELLTGNIFQRIIERCIEHKSISAVKSSGLKNEFAVCMQNMLIELEKDDENISFTQIWLQVNALFVFQYHIFGNIDKKLLRRLIEVNKKVCACTLFGNVLWYPEKFLMKHIPVISKLFEEKTFLTNRQTHIANRSQNLLKDSYSLCMQNQEYTGKKSFLDALKNGTKIKRFFSTFLDNYLFLTNDVILINKGTNWMIQMETIMKLDMSSLKMKQLNHQYLLLVQGIKLMKRTSEIVKWITNLHAAEGKPMTKTVVLVLCRLVELLEGFYLTMQHHSVPLVQCIYLVSQHISYQALTIISNIKKGIVQDKSYNDQHLDVLSSLNVAERVLNGPYTSDRILVTRLALSAAGLNYAQAEDSLSQLRGHLTRLELVCNVKELLYKLCDCSFLYWHQVIMPVYFTCLFETKSDLSRMLLMFTALTDCESNSFIVDGNKISTKIHKMLSNNFMQPLCQSIETNLRIQTHSHLQMTTTSPFEEQFFENQLLQTKNQHPFRFVDEYISVSGNIEHYLNTMFYNLTTVVLHDWQTYGEMRQLASLKYGLVTIQDHLPMQTLEQGLDVLEIMRNIHVFVSKYLYNMNNQIFVEEWSNNKHLNTINISHIANSIRTHGIGIMNTTVNFTYQFLQKKFYIFSQFMYDEHIKSRLLKDLRYFLDNKNDFDQMYPYERAEKFNQGIRKLGLTENGLSYLDLFRRLISHIGNAMGYVRLIRSGGRRFLSDATCFLPTFENLNSLNEFLESENPSKATAKAAECLKSDIKNLTDNFAEATEYFKLLINAFSPAFRNTQNIHLKNFYMIVPPLTINFVEHSLTCKDRINKKNKTGAAFTDDGFAMGLAFIIQLLEQGSQLNSLYWFQSVKAKHTRERQKLDEQKAVVNKDDAKLQQTLALTEKRLSLIDQEFELLFCSLNSARIFFTDSRF